MQKDQTNHSAEKNTAYTKLKSGEELTASEMKVCLEVCKTYSTDNLNKKPENILDSVPFDTDG
jgi:hemerythrin superfamily protein